jgi:hypothetical protein
MSHIEHLPIDPARLAAMRAAGADEFANPWTMRTAEGWEPLRCCLRRADRDEPIALICFTPWTAPSPWAEAGPVFVHHDACEGYADTGRYPQAFLESPSIVNPFDHTGARAYAHITFLEPHDDHEAAVREVLAAPEVSFAHIRSATAGCFTFAVRRVA